MPTCGKSLLKSRSRHALVGSLCGIIALSSPAIAQQNSLEPVRGVSVVAQNPMVPTRPYLATFGWAEGCGDHRVEAWSRVGQAPADKWNFEPVPLSVIREKYPYYDDSGAVYYIESNEMAVLGCEMRWLSGASGCGTSHEDRRVRLWNNKDESGIQWWNVVSASGGGYIIENFHNNSNCGGEHKYLGTDTNTAVRWNDLDYEGMNFKWDIAGLSVQRELDPGNVVAQGRWEFMCSRGSAKCEATSVERFSVSSTLAKNWSEELETSLATTLETSVTAGAEAGMGSNKVTAETSVSTSITAGLRAAVAKSRNESGTNEQELSNTITCGPTVPKDRDVYRWTVTARLGSERVTMTTCQFGCTSDGQPPTGGPNSNLDSCLIE